MPQNNSGPLMLRVRSARNLRDEMRQNTQFGVRSIRNGFLQIRSQAPGFPAVREKINEVRARRGLPPVNRSPLQNGEGNGGGGGTTTTTAGSATTIGTGTGTTTSSTSDVSTNTTVLSGIGGQAATNTVGDTTANVQSTTTLSLLGGGF